MKVSDAVARFLSNQGIEVIFGYQGGAITHLIDSFDKQGIKYIQTYNEQGAALAADAFARTSEVGLGVAIATNGPGATNLLTGIANAYCDSIPVLFLTGQVHTFAMKKSNSVRQESFQEIDILSMARPVTKYAVTVMEKEQVLPELRKAIQIAKEGRPGPVLVDLPVDVQGYDLEINNEDILFCKVDLEKRKICSSDDIKKIISLLEEAKKPLIIAGGGIRCSGATKIFRDFVQQTGIPVCTSLMGLDAVDQTDENFVGFIGSYGNRYANLAVQNADVIVVLGSRLDMRQTGKRKDLFANNAKIIHIDIDTTELNHFVREDVSIYGDLKLILEQLCKEEVSMRIDPNWKQSIAQWKDMYAEVEEFSAKKELEADLNPNEVMSIIGKSTKCGDVVCADVGQNQMWLAQSLRGADIRILNSGGLGTMGYSLPASIGATFACPNSRVYAVMGDGGLQMNIQELQVLGQYQLPVSVFVMNNHALGLIRDVHEKYYDSRYVGSVEGFSMPDLCDIAQAYHLCYEKVKDLVTLEQVTRRTNKPVIVEVEFDGNTYVRPELLGTDGLDRQFPYKE